MNIGLENWNTDLEENVWDTALDNTLCGSVGNPETNYDINPLDISLGQDEYIPPLFEASDFNTIIPENTNLESGCTSPLETSSLEDTPDPLSLSPSPLPLNMIKVKTEPGVTAPRIKTESRSVSGSSRSNLSVNLKRERKLARNRLSAKKSRQKKKNYILQLEEQLEKMNILNKQLEGKVKDLNEEVVKLKSSRLNPSTSQKDLKDVSNSCALVANADDAGVKNPSFLLDTASPLPLGVEAGELDSTKMLQELQRCCASGQLEESCLKSFQWFLGVLPLMITYYLTKVQGRKSITIDTPVKIEPLTPSQ